MFKKISLLLLSLSFVFAQTSLNELSDLEDLKKLSESNDLLTESLINDKSISQKEIKNVTLESISTSDEPSFFGYDYFSKTINFVDNIPAPSDYKLGPGDEIILSIWGQYTTQKKFILNTNGSFFYENLGYINLLNKTLDEASLILENELSKIYETINDSSNPTQVMLELGSIKSINVYVSGETKSPGINLIHPFSDIFLALNQVGITNNGSLRNIQLIRDGESIAQFDFYEFFIDGINNFSNLRLLDGDIIHIPVVKNRIEVKGQVVRPQFYEFLNTDSLSELINYAGGLSPTASNKAVLNSIMPNNDRLSDDLSKYGLVVDIFSNQEIRFENGSSIDFLPVADNNKDVQIFGKVTLPGIYPAFTLKVTKDNKQILEPNSLKDILDLAGGFDDPIFRKSVDDNIVILRQDENQFYAKTINVNYDESSNFLLEINDKIFVYEKSDYDNSFTYNIEGEVNKPGTYPLLPGITLKEAIDKAGGLTEVGSINSISVTKSTKFIDENGQPIAEDALVGNISLDFQVTDNNTITILPITNVIRVQGNVYNPGFVAHQSGKRMTMYNAIELAGGYKPNSLKSRSYVVRANGEIEKANIFRGRTKRVFPGDSIFIPLDPKPDDFEITTFIAELSSTLANIVAILVLVDNNNN